MKLLRCGDWRAFIISAVILKNCLVKLASGTITGRPKGASWIVMFFRGMAASFRLRIDKEHGTYLPGGSEARRSVGSSSG
jgi:hypothetical protein